MFSFQIHSLTSLLSAKLVQVECNIKQTRLFLLPRRNLTSLLSAKLIFYSEFAESLIINKYLYITLLQQLKIKFKFTHNKS